MYFKGCVHFFSPLLLLYCAEHFITQSLEKLQHFLEFVPKKKKKNTLADRSTFSQLVKLGKRWVVSRLLKSINQITWQHPHQIIARKTNPFTKTLDWYKWYFLFTSHGYVDILGNKKIELISFNTARNTFQNKW